MVDQVQRTIILNNDSVDMLKDVVLNQVVNFMSYVQGVGIPIFEEFERRIFEAELKVEQERRRSTQHLARVESQIERVNFEGRQLAEYCGQVEKTKCQLVEQFHDVKKLNIDFTNQIINATQNLQAELTANFTWVRQ